MLATASETAGKQRETNACLHIKVYHHPSPPHTDRQTHTMFQWIPSVHKISCPHNTIKTVWFFFNLLILDRLNKSDLVTIPGIGHWATRNPRVIQLWLKSAFLKESKFHCSWKTARGNKKTQATQLTKLPFESHWLISTHSEILNLMQNLHFTCTISNVQTNRPSFNTLRPLSFVLRMGCYGSQPAEAVSAAKR